MSAKSEFSFQFFFMILLLFFYNSASGQFREKVQKIFKSIDNNGDGRIEKLISRFEKGQPVSTTFDDAVYEAVFLENFEPMEDDYQPLDVQPKSTNGGYRLQSGLYTMNARSFCLRGYTHGPSKGDGHLYAPMKGKKAGLVQAIIRNYALNPDIPQQDVQVLLWAIIAGSDMKTLGHHHAQTLNLLFTPQELLTFAGKDWLDGYAQKQFDELKKVIFNKTPPQLQALLDADNKIRTMVSENKTFQEIEKFAILAGVAPREMIREVSKGQWSYHPDGFFVRFFPNGYSQTRVDVYVPFDNAVRLDSDGNATEINFQANQPKIVVFDPSGMVASPANRPSQRIGISPVPVDPTKGQYEIIFYGYGAGQEVPVSRNNLELHSSLAGHMFMGFAKDGRIEQVKGLSPEKDGEGGDVRTETDESHLLGYHSHCFVVKVTPQQYFEALNVVMGSYFIGTNDCVSYADKIADLLGLKTPELADGIVFPYEYILYLINNNRETGTSNHPYCDIKPIQHSLARYNPRNS